MNIRIALAAFALVALAAAASAAPKWNGAGWYVVYDTEVGYFVDKGPFTSKETCIAVMPDDDADALYECTYLATQPTWDT